MRSSPWFALWFTIAALPACSDTCQSYSVIGDQSVIATTCPDGSNYELRCERVGENTHTHGWHGDYACVCDRDGVAERSLDRSPIPWLPDGHPTPVAVRSVNDACRWRIPVPGR